MNGVPLNINFQQILLHLLNFLILFAILYFLLYKPIRNFMDKRQAMYKEADEKAAQTTQEANQLKEQYEAEMLAAQKEIDEKRRAFAVELEEQAKQSRADALAQAEGILDKARKQAEADRDRIIAESGEQVSKLAKEAAAKAIFKDTSDAYDAFLKSTEE